MDLVLPPPDAARLRRLPVLTQQRTGRPVSTVVELIWYDTDDGQLAGDGMALCARRVGRVRDWRLEWLRPAAPGVAPPLLAEAATRDALGHDLPVRLLPVASCSGRLLTVRLGDMTELRMLDGRLRSAAAEHPVCRVSLHGAAPAVAALALALAGMVPLAAPHTSLPGEALVLAGRTVPAPPGPNLTGDVPVGAAFAAIIGHLAGVLLRLAPEAAADTGPEAVHQMRVALRRLRSAMRLFRRVIDATLLDDLKSDLKTLSQQLGPARDWDVFTAGTGRAVVACFPDDRAVARLLTVAQRRRTESYKALAAYLHGAGFHTLILRLGCLAAHRPWEQPHAPAEAPGAPDAGAADADKRAAAIAAPLADFAGRSLSRQLAHVLRPGADLSALPAEALHALRIQGKRLRYAAEFFAPLYPSRPTRRFIRRLAVLQDCLGHLNDGTVAAHLMAELGGAGRGYAAGVVRGFVAAGRPDIHAGVDRAWRRFRRLPAFWD